ncbi:metal ABC transporter permease [Deinococcus peraridilitoris]|uniref:ABC-type Mn2+/Zn2+ transport system, permease component n=1 Tax=Deinococcus peraridilitoris (strain DSM 19664 / LMG 22246 / CIP 109416 / KR-200) TaxID=937777 RepID=L0A456_DEIPD|nr:metal ABC transporter permease [Deinococcus peraridilitoris]AFZ67977.1 ABC-type Mn2+/Zn2+ transport system, permease component [Deinococcus peraridilitoris DSM 19664]
MNWLLEPLQYEFFVRALLSVTVVSVLCAVIGVYVVLRGLSYIGDAMSHAVFPGIVAAFLLKLNLLGGAVLAALVTSLGIGFVTQRSGLKQDSAIGIVFVGMFALGVVLLSSARSYAVDLANFLVGNPLGVSAQDLWASLIVTGLIGLTLTVFQKELLLISFDPTEARAIGLPVGRLNNLLLMLIALVVVLTIQLVGTTLSVSLLITSSATARLLTRNLRAMMLVAALIGSLSGVIGLYASYYLNVAPGATVVLTNTLTFLLVLMTRPRLT